MATESNEPHLQPPIYVGHVESPFFKQFPPEIRLMIYEMALSGSRLTLDLGRPRLPYSHGLPIEDRGRTIFRSTGHHNLLLTCHAVYEEALSQYWSNTIVFCGCEGHKGGRVSPYGFLSYKTSFHLSYLAGRISCFAKGQIKHLRRLDVLKPLSYRRRPDTASLGLREFLALFPRLETCVLDSCHKHLHLDIRTSNLDNPIRDLMGATAYEIGIHPQTCARNSPTSTSSSVKVIQKLKCYYFRGTQLEGIPRKVAVVDYTKGSFLVRDRDNFLDTHNYDGLFGVAQEDLDNLENK